MQLIIGRDGDHGDNGVANPLELDFCETVAVVPTLLMAIVSRAAITGGFFDGTD